MNAATLIWEAAGRPIDEKCTDVHGRCYLCASEFDRGASRDLVLLDTFTGHDGARFPSSKFVCEACAWSLNDHSLVVGRTGGKWRNYSHAAVYGKWLTFTKKVEERRVLRDLLCAPPDSEWCAVVAESGQKQLAYRGPVSRGNRRCSVLFEERVVSYQPSALADIVATVEAMIVTFSKTEVSSGAWINRRIVEFGPDRFAELDAILRPVRGSALFDLAVFLAAKSDEEKETEDGTIGTENEGGGPSGSHLDDGGPRCVGKAEDGDLAHFSGEHRDVCDDDSGPRKVRQLSLFGDAGDAGKR